MFVDQHLGCHSRVVKVNDATRNVTMFAVPCLGVFLSAFQRCVPGISQNISCWLRIQNTNSKHRWAWIFEFLNCCVRLLHLVPISMSCSAHVLSLPTHKDSVSLSIKLTIRNSRCTKKLPEMSMVWYLWEMGTISEKCFNFFWLIWTLKYIALLVILFARILDPWCVGWKMG